MDSNPDDGLKSQSGMLRSLNIALMVITSIILLARIKVRAFMTKALGIDDALAVVAYVSVLARNAMSRTCIANRSAPITSSSQWPCQPWK